MKTRPNESAFPGDAATMSQSGLSKREYFAGLAMQGILSNPSFDLLEPAQYAHNAVQAADALIAELNNKEAA